MEIFHSEYEVKYDTYTFSYAVYCMPHSAEELGDVYAKGFLPYSGARSPSSVFYLARSVRIDLDRFSLSKNDRYICKTVDRHGITMTVIPKLEGMALPMFRRTCLDFAARKFGSSVMNESRLDYIVNSDFLTHIGVFHAHGSDAPFGFALFVTASNARHVWYTFYNPVNGTEKNIGKYLLIKIIENSKQEGFRFCYLGTSYKKHSRYKAEFKGAEFFDGRTWNKDMQLLKTLWKKDDEEPSTGRATDHWKQGLEGWT